MIRHVQDERRAIALFFFVYESGGVGIDRQLLMKHFGSRPSIRHESPVVKCDTKHAELSSGKDTN